MAESHVNQGIEAGAGHAGGESKDGSTRRETRHRCRCGETDPSAFYASMPYRCKTCQREKMRALYATPEYRAVNSERQRERLRDQAESKKHRARTALGLAVKEGKVERPVWCQDCGILGPVHGHHEDYDKPLGVVWLCRRCHSKRHGGYAKRAILSALAAVCLLSACAADPVTSAWYAENPRTWRAESPERMLVWDASRTDCVGFVLRWRARLIAAGVPEADLVIANFHTPQGWHAALLVRRPDGQWVLDNMARGPYRWVPPKGWFERAPDGRVIALHGNEVRIAIP